MKKAIITGATSFIGRHLTDRLLAEGWGIYAIVRKGSEGRNLLPVNKNVKVLELDMSEYGKLSFLIQENCDAYVSLAWNGTRGAAREDGKRQEENCIYSIEALKAAYNTGCRVVISAGSQAEYGPMTDKVKESAACHPNTEYGKWKLKYYEYAAKFCAAHGLSFKEPRFFSLYGEDDNETTMILSILDDMLSDRSCRLTKCIQLWDFLYIEDAIDGIFRLINMKCDDGVYNFGSGDTRPLREFVMEMYRLTESHSELLFGEVPYPATGMVNVYPDISRLRQQTGWEAATAFSEGIKRIIEYKQRMPENSL